MKIIDKTPLLDEQGNLGIVQRLQGMLQYGFNWPRELQAQSTIINYFGRQLEKGYTLIRNMPLGASGIMIPMILLGPTGIYVIEVSYLRGRYEAKGDSWNVESGDQYKPAPVNLIQRTQRMARALQVYIERQGVKVPAPIESVLIAGDPGLHIESVRPAIKVMMIDGIKTFVNGLATGRPVMSNEQAHDFADRIVTPRLKKDEAVAPAPEPEPEPRAAWEQWYEEPVQQQEDPRTRGLMNAAAEAKTVHPENLDFAFAEDDDMSAESIPPVKRASPAGAAQTNKPQQLMFGMTPVQLAVIGALALALICILAVFAYVVTTL
jgi:nuclease-like protein